MPHKVNIERAPGALLFEPLQEPYFELAPSSLRSESVLLKCFSQAPKQATQGFWCKSSSAWSN